ncbi:unnamed protein product [Trichogramma brassicae]|uniref:Uncharacterized protein n=1 Tax=Trichogramma brassicae TaxID=86971 RepID=A0A6H5I289_9HYME|nr:unnamed protein product [Trichogramma brassicae]
MMLHRSSSSRRKRPSQGSLANQQHQHLQQQQLHNQLQQQQQQQSQQVPRSSGRRASVASTEPSSEHPAILLQLNLRQRSPRGSCVPNIALEPEDETPEEGHSRRSTADSRRARENIVRKAIPDVCARAAAATCSDTDVQSATVAGSGAMRRAAHEPGAGRRSESQPPRLARARRLRHDQPLAARLPDTGRLLAEQPRAHRQLEESATLAGAGLGAEPEKQPVPLLDSAYGHNRSPRGSLVPAGSRTSLMPTDQNGQLSRGGMSIGSRHSLVPDQSRSPRGSVANIDLLDRSARGSISCQDSMSRSPRGSIAPIDMKDRSPRGSIASECLNQSPRGSIAPEMINRSPRGSIAPDLLNRSPRGSICPEMSMAGQQRSPRGSIGPHDSGMPTNRSPRGSIGMMSGEHRGSLTAEDELLCNRSPRGSIGPDTDRSPRGSLGGSQDRRLPRMSYSVQDNRRSSADHGTPSRNRSGSPYHQRGDTSGSVRSTGSGHAVLGNHSGGVGYGATTTTSATTQQQQQQQQVPTANYGAWADSRRASSSVSQFSGDESRRLCGNNNYSSSSGNVNYVEKGLQCGSSGIVGGIISSHQQPVNKSQQQQQVNNEPTSVAAYGSLVFQLKVAHLEAEGTCDFVYRALRVVSKTMLVTCCLVLLTAMPIVMLILGAQFIRDCPREPNIPVYMIVGGTLGAMRMFWTLYSQIRSRRPKVLSMPGSRTKFSPKMLASIMLTTFLFGWFLLEKIKYLEKQKMEVDVAVSTEEDENDEGQDDSNKPPSITLNRFKEKLNFKFSAAEMLYMTRYLGNYWILSIRWPDYSPTLFEPNRWCHRTLYAFSLVHLFVIYVVIFVSVVTSLLLFFCRILACPLPDRHSIRQQRSEGHRDSVKATTSGRSGSLRRQDKLLQQHQQLQQQLQPPQLLEKIAEKDEDVSPNGQTETSNASTTAIATSELQQRNMAPRTPGAVVVSGSVGGGGGNVLDSKINNQSLRKIVFRRRIGRNAWIDVYPRITLEIIYYIAIYKLAFVFRVRARYDRAKPIRDQRFAGMKRKRESMQIEKGYGAPGLLEKLEVSRISTYAIGAVYSRGITQVYIIRRAQRMQRTWKIANNTRTQKIKYLEKQKMEVDVAVSTEEDENDEGQDDSNKPPSITLNRFKEKLNFKFSAAEMLYMTRYLGARGAYIVQKSQLLHLRMPLPPRRVPSLIFSVKKLSLSRTTTRNKIKLKTLHARHARIYIKKLSHKRARGTFSFLLVALQYTKPRESRESIHEYISNVYMPHVILTDTYIFLASTISDAKRKSRAVPCAHGDGATESRRRKKNTHTQKIVAQTIIDQKMCKLTRRWIEQSVGLDAAGNEERHQGNDEQDERYQFHDCRLSNLFMSFTEEGTRHLVVKTRSRKRSNAAFRAWRTKYNGPMSNSDGSGGGYIALDDRRDAAARSFIIYYAYSEVESWRSFSHARRHISRNPIAIEYNGTMRRYCARYEIIIIARTRVAR